MHNDWTSIRRQLGPEFNYGPGHWFCVRHEDVQREDGSLFSKKRGGTGRRVVLATDYGPNVTLFARSASVPSAYAHPAHNHASDFSRCQLDEDGWINFRIPVVVPVSSLCDDNYSCDEPAESTLRAEMQRALRL